MAAEPVCRDVSLDEFAHRGFVIVPSLLDEVTIAQLVETLDEALNRDDRLGRSRHAMRHLLTRVEAIRRLVRNSVIGDLIRDLTGDTAGAVRGIYFDKLPGANWKVPWHQDRTIAVKRRLEVEGFGPWSEKEGVVHVEPPQSVLMDMVAIRISLDGCTAGNGALRVIPGSHCEGKLSPDQVSSLRQRIGEVVCEVPQGGAMLMRPLLLHASSPAVAPLHRRVIHLEFAGAALLGGLDWAEFVPIAPGR